MWDLLVDYTGIGELDGITEMDLSGVDFADITDLGPLYVMDDLTDCGWRAPATWMLRTWTHCSTTWRPSKELPPRAPCI